MKDTDKAARSAGARLERKVLRAKVRRVLKRNPNDPTALELLEFLLTRQKRYEPRPGGLGRK